MLIFCALVAVDFLLPSVKIPLFAWIILVLFLIIPRVIKEAQPKPAPKKCTPEISPQTWIKDPRDAETFVNVDGTWALATVDSEKFALWGENEQFIDLSQAKTLGQAMDMADLIINTLEEN